MIFMVRENPTRKEPIKELPNGKKLGWIKDKKSVRKALLTPRSPEVKAFFDKIFAEPLKDEVDLEKYAPAVWDQGNLGSCTANAIGMAIQIMEKIEYGESKEPSRLYLYKKTRDYEGSTGDSGATITGTVETAVRTGVCLETTWPYIISKFEDEPSEEAEEEGLDYQTLEQVALSNLDEIKATLSAGYPVVLGIFVFDSFMQIGTDGIMPLPDLKSENFLGGHALCLLGYKKINNVLYLKVRNSWNGWGENNEGNFWMPAEYFTTEYDYYGEKYNCCSDFRVILKQEFANQGESTNF